LGSSPVRQKQVAHAAGGGAHEVGLQRDAVAIAAGELEDRLDPGANEERGGERRREMRAGAGAIGDVDGICEVRKRARLASRSSASHDTGGVISVVMANCRDRSTSSRRDAAVAALCSSLVRWCVARAAQGRGDGKPPI